MEDLAGPIIILVLIGAAIYLVFVAVAWGGLVACLALTFISGNVLALSDKLLCWTDFVPPSWHWVISGFLMGALLHFAVREAPRTNRPRVKAAVLMAVTGISALSIVFHVQSGISLRWTTRDRGYPIHGTVPITQARWTDPIVVRWGENMRWNVIENNVCLDTLLNKTTVYSQPRQSDPTWKPLVLGDVTRTMQFRITPGTDAATGTIAYTITKE